ncbi:MULTISPECIES: Zn-ribbon domain-containing OB-fold protein [Acidiplasma]|uniref:Nucleotide-binding protein n=2 Tax=Acidiplasma TaxID=507753 RepID=A0A0Q0VRX9_9ARCH|nr:MULTISPECIES: Zn-ribbon domain-containing OB-fold protein [Acidiplasma]KPV47607.1 nucleotide-binding protein [Acidiplasma aeolicum]KQB34008.1 nucleotide-binding protein [Acidiplasma cupricumulans]
MDRYTRVMKTDPLVKEFDYNIEYIHSYAQDSKFFTSLGRGILLGSECKKCNYRYGTYRKYCMFCGSETDDINLPLTGKIHSFTTCYYSGENFINETPYTLILVEFEGIDSLFMSRLVNKENKNVYIGMPVRAKFRRLQKFDVNDVYFVPA